MTLIEQLTAVITAIAEDISNNISNNGGSSGNTDSSSSDVTALLPRKIGAAQKWYQSGLRYGADYPYPYLASSGGSVSGVQSFVPFTALEDAKITGLEVYCSTGKTGTTISLGIYASDSNNDIAGPLFTSDPISCDATGAKNAPCNVQIKKGKVYWLSTLSKGTTMFHRNSADSLFPIKGTTKANQPSIIGYYTTSNTSMAQSAPIYKTDLDADAPRVLFITG